MCLFGDFLLNLYEFLTKTRNIPPNNIIRKHTKKLQQLGDLSFPLILQNWCQLISVDRENLQLLTIFDYALGNNNIEWQIQQLINTSLKWQIQIDKIQIRNGEAYLFLNQQSVYNCCIKTVMETKEKFGALDKCFKRLITIEVDDDIIEKGQDLNLTELRAIILKNTTGNILKYLTINDAEHDEIIKITLKSNNKFNNYILCGSVLNENGSKDTETTANNLYKKRSVEIQLMAQHKYGIRLNTNLRDYFDKLGRNCVILEMLQNRPQRNIKLTSSKSPCFIFYNCARLSALLKEFDNKINCGIYPELPSIERIDFNQLKQPEEWEILFVYILQFPLLLKSCIVDINDGIINPHYLVGYLANLSSIFSVYYRRIKILTIPKDHLFATLFARIYLLKSLQYVFHIVLNLLDIEPVKEM